ncbi:MAG TPA: cyclic nucleotide-binding domain-containing protein [Candidatus Limnocylindrales bacterium]|nr:cyclic nucleotide-binding domain-containing protein [Candidatus Limnocylindrales bacterium]
MAQSAADGFEIVIVGGGPAGLAAGSQAARRGVSHVVLERGRLANTIFKYQKGKHVMDEPPALELRKDLALPFQAGRREQVLEGWASATAAAGTNLWSGAEFEVARIEGAAGDFTVTLKNGRRLGARAIVLAIGLQGNLRMFECEGAHLPHVTYQLDDPGEHADKRVVVVGVGDAGIENALALAERNEVAIVNRRDDFARAKPRNRQAIEQAIKQGAIAHYTHAQVQRIIEGGVVLETRDGELELPCEMLIGRLGAVPPRKFLEGLGVAFASEGESAVPPISQSYESNVAGIHLVGAIAGYPLIKHCMNQGYEVIEHILGNHVEPGDEPILREKFAALRGSVSEVLERIQNRLPVFAGITAIQLREFLVDSDVHTPAKDQVVYRRNDFTDSFYSVLDGYVEVVAPPSDEANDTTYRHDGAGGEEKRFRVGAGEFFGEMSLLSGRRRSATVIAGEGCVLIETPRLSMIKLMSSVPSVRRAIDEVFILRKLQTQLAPGVPVAELRELAHQSVIESFRQGQVLFEEGADSNGLHLIRRGSVTVSRRRGGVDQVLAYLPAGNIIGEMALFAPQGKRSATVRATIYTETIRIPTDALLPFVERHAELRKELKALESTRLIDNAVRASDKRSSDLVEFLMSAGAGEATDILLIDESLCVRCDNCESACAATHGGVSRLDREAGPTFATVHIPTSCRHCENPKCMTDCPPDALRRHPNGEVYIMDNCIGCGNCASNCPYGVIQMAAVDRKPAPNVLLRLLFGWGERRRADQEKADQAKVAVKCDLCMSLPAKRGAPRAACVASCPTGAIVRVAPKTYVDRLLAR